MATTDTEITSSLYCKCLNCGEENLSVELEDITAIHCNNCDEKFRAEDIEAAVADLARVAKWLRANEAFLGRKQ